ncbi:hypothetical protein HZS_7801 [Henneguya salminicola]|nr:hypothetical protein HZS_7801 [Henneguya salminicola]
MLLSFGAQFDFKKFKKDAELFKILKPVMQNDFLQDINCNLEPTKRKKNEEVEKITKKNKLDIRLEHGIHAFGNKIADPIKSFSNCLLPIPSYLKDSMKKMKYEIPTPVQMQAIALLLQNRHVLACAPTGSGKTFAYLFPILILLNQHKINKIFALIILPTKELATQIYNEISILTENSKVRVCRISKIAKNKIKNYNSYRKSRVANFR